MARHLPQQRSQVPRRLARQALAQAAWYTNPAQPERAHRLLVRSQWWAPDALQELQLHALRQLVAGVATMPFYRERLALAGVRADTIRSLADLRSVPPLERAELPTLFDQVSRSAARLGRRLWTTGSTGPPVSVVWSLEMSRWADAAELRGREWLGVAFHERRWRIKCGTPAESITAHPHNGQAVNPATRINTLGAFASNTRMVYAVSLRRPGRLEELYEQFVHERPVLVQGVSNGLYALADAFPRDALPPVRACWSGGNHLPDHYRSCLQEVFGCRVHRRYGSVETGPIAHECPTCRTLHVCAESVMVEVVRPDGSWARPDEMGDLLITCLHNRAMPLLRYRVGDRALGLETGIKRCGRGLADLPLLGRSDEFLFPAAGKPIPPAAVHASVLHAAEDVHDFQVRQESDGHAEVSVVTRASLPAPRREAIAAAVDRLLQVPGATRVREVREIPLTPGGKLRHILGRVEPEAAAQPGTVAGTLG